MMVGKLPHVLRSSPLPEDVHLELCVFMTEPEVSILHYPTVSLPRLRKFFLSCTPPPAPFLTSIIFPPTACVLAQINAGGLGVHDPMSQLGQPLSPLISESNELVFSALEMPASFTLNLKEDGETRVKLEFHGLGLPSHLRLTLTSIATCPLDAVQRFVIGGIGEGVADHQVFGAIQGLRNVETLVLNNAAHLLPLLLLSDARNHARNHRLLCLRLETLAIDEDQETPTRTLCR